MQIDPFGHSNTHAWLLGAEAGMDSMFWGRTDYQDKNYRMSWQGKESGHWLEWVWRGSQSLGAAADVFAGQLTTGGYSGPIRFNDAGVQCQDDPRRHDYNIDEQVDNFIQQALKLQNNTRGNHQMWPLGGDFQYQVRRAVRCPEYPTPSATHGRVPRVRLAPFSLSTALDFPLHRC